METLAGMRIFNRVVEAGSFSEVGRQLGIAPSSVSRQINELEESLGALTDSNLLARKISSSRRICCGSASYLKDAEPLKSPEDLLNHTCLTFRSNTVWGKSPTASATVSVKFSTTMRTGEPLNKSVEKVVGGPVHRSAPVPGGNA